MMLKNPFKILSGRNVSPENDDTKDRIPYGDKWRGKDDEEVDFATEAIENLEISTDMEIGSDHRETDSAIWSGGTQETTLMSIADKRATNKNGAHQDLTPYEK